MSLDQNLDLYRRKEYLRYDGAFFHFSIRSKDHDLASILPSRAFDSHPDTYLWRSFFSRSKMHFRKSPFFFPCNLTRNLKI